jgi:hypothetical protein
LAGPRPPRFAPGSAELEVAAPSLQGFLYNQLVLGEKLATAVSAHMELLHLAGAAVVTLDLASGVSPRIALAALDEAIDHIRALHSRFDIVQFAINRARLLAEPLYSAERLSSRAALLQVCNADAGTPDCVDPLLAGRTAVLVEDVRKALYDFLRPDRRVVIEVTPRSDAPRGGRLVGPS